MLLAMYAALFLLFPTLASAQVDPACSYPESLIVDALQTDSRPTVILEGPKIAAFFAKMAEHGWKVQVHKIDKIYLIDAKMEPGAKGRDVWVYFLFAGCIMDREPMDKSIVEGMLI